MEEEAAITPAESVTTIDEQDLKEIRDIFVSHQDKLAKMGIIAFERLDLSERLDELKTQEDVLVAERVELSDKEQVLTKTLNEKYGEGTLDINTGEFKATG